MRSGPWWSGHRACEQHIQVFYPCVLSMCHAHTGRKELRQVQRLPCGLRHSLGCTTGYRTHPAWRISSCTCSRWGTGQAVIQVALFLGVKLFVTVGSGEKKNLLMKLYGIPEEHILYSRDTTFARGIMRMTGKRGVDVILNSRSGEMLRANWDCLAPVQSTSQASSYSSADNKSSWVVSSKLARGTSMIMPIYRCGISTTM